MYMFAIFILWHTNLSYENISCLQLVMSFIKKGFLKYIVLDILAFVLLLQLPLYHVLSHCFHINNSSFRMSYCSLVLFVDVYFALAVFSFDVSYIIILFKTVFLHKILVHLLILQMFHLCWLRYVVFSLCDCFLFQNLFHIVAVSVIVSFICVTIIVVVLTVMNYFYFICYVNSCFCCLAYKSYNYIVCFNC